MQWDLSTTYLMGCNEIVWQRFDRNVLYLEMLNMIEWEYDHICIIYCIADHSFSQTTANYFQLYTLRDCCTKSNIKRGASLVVVLVVPETL